MIILTAVLAAAAPTSIYAVFTGDGTYFTPGLGACGIVNNASDAIVALNAPQFDPFTPGTNPNLNTICGKMVNITRVNVTVSATITDRCPVCKYGDLDMSPELFNQLANPVLGRVNISWVWADGGLTEGGVD